MSQAILKGKVSRIIFTAGIVAMGVVAQADETNVSPYAKGGDVSVVETPMYRRYVHTFTNTESAATFRNRLDKPLRVRCLVVGGGGGGAAGAPSGGNFGGGGGGGGGVFEDYFDMAASARWRVLVGKGADGATFKTSGAMAGSSSISNAVTEVVCVPGGGNGSSANNAKIGVEATAGASGGGGSRLDVGKTGAAGTYASSVFGVRYPKNAGGDYDNNAGGGGGGAAGAGGKGGAYSDADTSKGGEGLVSDITGVSLVYGSGGGGGPGMRSGESFSGGRGGTRGGSAPQYILDDTNPVNIVTNWSAGALPIANSGGGGAGGAGGSSAQYRDAMAGADGIVVIAYEIYKIPFAGGEITKIAEHGTTATYIHVFTNAEEVATFENLCGEDVSVRYLVVGAGGGGAAGSSAGDFGGGGGAGGGVKEVANVTMSAAVTWDILVGKGANGTSSGQAVSAAGASSISNGHAEVVLVPGGGNGSYGLSAKSGVAATGGAAGGGGSRLELDVARGTKTIGAEGIYESSILGVSYPKNSGGNYSNYCSGGGGGAQESGSNGGQFSAGNAIGKGGEGLVSDITGESLVYGSGGGGGPGFQVNSSRNWPVFSGGRGGTRAGSSPRYEVITTDPDNVVTNWTVAVLPVTNSGGGGAGGAGGTAVPEEYRGAMRGADGVVIIRYDWTFDPSPKAPGLIMVVR